MRNFKQQPKALFGTLDNLADKPDCVTQYLNSLSIETVKQEYKITCDFLESYGGSQDTFTAYRREVERLVHWAWLIAKKPIAALDRNDIRHFIEFVGNPPDAWIGTKTVQRFSRRNGQLIHNPEWRPFVVRIPKAQFKAGKTPDRISYRLTNASLAALFAVIGTYYTYLQQECYVKINPVQLVRQKSQIIQKQQSIKVTRKLSLIQWQFVLDAIEDLADVESEYERHLFLLTAFYLLGLRISELAETPGRIPAMGDFAPDKNSRWWFTTVGKGNKVRDVAVPDAMLDALKRYRRELDLPPLPTRGEQTPLVHKKRGRGGLGTRQIRNLIQYCFDLAIRKLEQAGKADEAADLATATVHWLRHTAISADVEHRPREHVRDDAGHENASITDRYIDTDRIARHDSAKNKPLLPETKE